MNDLTDAQKDLIRVRKEIRAMDKQLREEAASEAMWRQSGDWVEEALMLQAESRARRESEHRSFVLGLELEAMETELDLG